MTKRERQKEIVNLITSKDIETQYHLIDELEKIGIKTTQATLSRDIKELLLIKELTPYGTYRYVTSVKPGALNNIVKLDNIFKESVTSFGMASNIVVVRTLPGLASAACSALDSMGIKNLVGTLAGDDTGSLAMSDIESAKHLCSEIEKMLK
jgi:transcriptional regulator of arginine metabolism